MALKELTGLTFHTLDSKNRLFIPAKYRGKLKYYVLTSGIDNCIHIYPIEIWNKVVEKINSISLPNKTHQRAFITTFFADIEVVKIDNQGRILIPQKFKDKYSIKSEVVLVGAKDKLQLWDVKEWEKFNKQFMKIFNKIKAKLDI